MITPEFINDFAWEVEAHKNDSGEVVTRFLVIKIPATVSITIRNPQTGAEQVQEVEIEARRIVLPFGLDPGTGRGMWVRVGKALAGDPVAPEIQVARSMPIQRPVNGGS